MSQIIHSVHIKEWACQMGFSLVGIAPADAISDGDSLRNYLAKGYHGGMAYLARNVEQRIDPRKLVPGARSIICTAINYFSQADTKQAKEPCGRIARYAWGRDYHKVVKERLKRLAGRIREAAGGEAELRCFVDTVPLVEKFHAVRAGLGWIGKNGLLVNETYGSWLVLGEIVTDLEFDYDQPVDDKCGSCRRCLQACPTAALVAPRVLDARRCISYLTIESKEQMPTELAGRTGDWLFGCDACQEVCPFNEHAVPTAEPDLQPNERWRRVPLAAALRMNREQFCEYFAGSSIERCRWEHFLSVARNCQKNKAATIHGCRL